MVYKLDPELSILSTMSEIQNTFPILKNNAQSKTIYIHIDNDKKTKPSE